MVTGRYMGDFWVFGYGSLIWRPGFEFIDEKKALLRGRHRALCVHSWVHRGTKDRPGLVLGLDEGGACHGLARLVAGKKREAVIAYLRERELVTHVYLEKWVTITLEGGENVQALTYVVDPGHTQYASGMSLSETAQQIRQAHGKSGPNTDYVRNTVQSLIDLDIRDEALEELCKRL